MTKKQNSHKREKAQREIPEGTRYKPPRNHNPTVTGSMFQSFDELLQHAWYVPSNRILIGWGLFRCHYMYSWLGLYWL